MIIMRLKGGLGNQMFQYALGRSLSLKKSAELGLDISFYDLNTFPKRTFDLDIFKISGKIIKQTDNSTFLKYLQKFPALIKIFYKLEKNAGKEKSFTFDSKVLDLPDGTVLDGYWQSPKYFQGFEDTIRKDFTLKNLPATNIQNLASTISSSNSLCIHVRRTDYVGNASHEVVNNDYYEKGILQILYKTKIEKIYVFSDDIKWCEENMKFNFPAMFVDESYAGMKGEGHMYLMSKCKNFIIANSSFSWWAAWLSENKNKIVVCPKQWFGDASINTSDLIPESWIRI